MRNVPGFYTVLVLLPRDAPAPSTPRWSLWELVLTRDDTELRVALSPAQREASQVPLVSAGLLVLESPETNVA